MQTINKLEPLDRSRWQTLFGNPDRFAAWHSPDFTVQAFTIPGGIIRLSTNRNQLSGDEKIYADGITWDELQAIKSQCGYGDRMAVEIYPADRHVLDIMNARHLWILPDPLPFAWTNP